MGNAQINGTSGTSDIDGLRSRRMSSRRLIGLGIDRFAGI
jgi:hypothetical protein